MPEVRHGSVTAGADPTSAAWSGPLPAGGGVDDERQQQQPTPPAPAATRPQPVQHDSSDSADTAVSATRQVSTMRRLSHAISGKSAQSSASGQSGRSAGGTPGRKSVSYAQRDRADAYYDSRAAGRKEWKRRAKNLQEYYDDNPHLLPQLPFSWHHGKRRWKIWFFAVCSFIDASIVPIVLYWCLKYSAGVKTHIIFAVITTIWGGPAYLEFAMRTLRLIKKENFYRPLGMDGRWGSDMTTWAASLTIFVLTALFIIGSAPRHTWLRVICMASVSILWCTGGVLLFIHLLHMYKRPAPFRISSTAKGEPVNAGAYYFMEDILAVNAGCGRPYREAIAARYKASPRFRQMLHEMSLFWSIPALVLATILTFVACLPWVPENWAYGVCWVAPFAWAFIWGCISIPWCKMHMVRERLEWEAGTFPKTLPGGQGSPASDGVAVTAPAATVTV